MAAISPLIVILGPTASGKSGLAIDLARKYDGEIICGDSQTLRKDMDIGTAKPTVEDQEQVPHHLIDIIGPYDDFTAAEFKKYCNAAISDISSRGKIPILVGGSGMYIDGVIFDYEFKPAADPKLRSQLDAKTIDQLQEIIKKNGYPMPENSKNPRHLIRTIETKGKKSERKELRQNTLLIGLTHSREILNERIEKRLTKMFDSGLIDEAKNLQKKYGNPPPSFDTIGYKIIFEYINNHHEISSQDKLILELNRAHKDLAKRQMTWFKRNKKINWIKSLTEADKLVNNFLKEI